MKQAVDNAEIRNDILDYLSKHGETEVREITRLFSTGRGTSRQRIAGNVSCMVCIDASVSLTRDYPHSRITRS